MPDPSVEPMPPLFSELRLTDPLDAQEASYFAASLKMASLSRSVVRAMLKAYTVRSLFYPVTDCRATPVKAVNGRLKPHAALVEAAFAMGAQMRALWRKSHKSRKECPRVAAS